MKNQRGFTLIELMVSIGIFGVASAMLATAFAHMMRTNFENDVRSGAYAAAQIVLDDLRSIDPATLPSSGASSAQTVDVGSRAYSVVTRYCTNSSFCISSTVRQIRVEVSFQGTQRYAVDAIFAQLR